MKILTYNVNGIRSALTKGFADWLKATNADMICLQEVKAEEHQIDKAIFEEMGYQVYWHHAEKKGYSGVAILTKITPKNIVHGCGIEIYDREGRVLRTDFEDFSLMSVYMPSGSSGDERQGFKMQWLTDFYEYIHELKKTVPNLIISGDYNICHHPIDIHNPKSNANSSGFLPEERAWVGSFLENGFIDTFRHFNQEPHHYTWWSYRAGARTKNLGWRIDYHCATEPMRERLVRSAILSEAKHSDHCPVLLEIN
ncbi:exodeoxyribonuclease-3 [Arcicella aurantiaca]|uniref:Exodeoxyribonuclease-3 n=1 Tax=Arcicella aurantiaca TaxID=591202 RepID=A0A316DI48_9BACT|nr:exodeoxyribonuclease III [Arcicella aurantiaca]PWK17841.1 exodeoxyribonuclease-3 [Arcicella aurantiaca]